MEPIVPCTCITAHDRMICVGLCKVLSPRDALNNRIRADRRNIGTIKSVTPLATLACLVADCAVRWREARMLGDKKILSGAEHNLDLIAQVWKERGV